MLLEEWVGDCTGVSCTKPHVESEEEEVAVVVVTDTVVEPRFIRKNSNIFDDSVERVACVS